MKKVEVYSEKRKDSKKIERIVLANFLADREAFSRVAHLVTEASFSDSIYSVIALVIRELFLAGIPIDPITVIEALKEKALENGQTGLDIVGGPTAILDISDEVTQAAHLEAHVSILLKVQMKRELIASTSNTLSKLSDPTTQVIEAIDDLQDNLLDIMSIGRSAKVTGISEAILELRNSVDAARNSSSDMVGLPSGLRELDKITLGFQAPDLIILAARPGMGKTSLALVIARNIALLNVGVVVFSLEMSSLQLTRRIVSVESGIPSGRLKTGDFINEVEDERYLRSLELINDLPIFIDDDAASTILDIRSRAKALKIRHPNIGLIIVDYIQLIGGSKSKNSNREQDVAAISRGLKVLAKELSVPVIALSQLSRAVEVRGGTKRPQLSDLRESGAIEQDADIVSFIYRPEYYQILEDENGDSLEGLAEIIIAKHRDGKLDTAIVSFEAPTTSFTNRDPFFTVPSTEPSIHPALPAESDNWIEDLEESPF